MKFQPPRGMRDFGPKEMAKREWMAGKIKEVAGRYGFETIQTPGVESWELLGKKGGGGELIRNEVYVFKDKSGRELGLRFEFTVSFARFLASNPQVPKPFKRWQMGPVWRYDRPQSGRYREFFCCELDIAGASGPEADAEILAVTCAILKEVDLDFKIRINNRKMVEGLLLSAGVKKESVIDVFRSIDKLAKVGVSGVEAEMESRKIPKAQAKKILSILSLKGDVLEKVEKSVGKDPVGKEGIENLREVIKIAKKSGFGDRLLVDLSLVRGLEYYTGCVWEIAGSSDLSLGGGGRYDKLVELYGGQPTPCVGIGLGFERIFDLIQEKLEIPPKTKVYVLNVKEIFLEKAGQIANDIRKAGIPAETDLMGRGLRKQMEYANSRGIPFVLFVGEKEIKSGRFVLKEMESGKENSLEVREIIKKVLEATH